MSGLILILTVSHLVRAVHGQVLREGERVDSGWSLHLIHTNISQIATTGEYINFAILWFVLFLYV